MCFLWSNSSFLLDTYKNIYFGNFILICTSRFIYLPIPENFLKKTLIKVRRWSVRVRYFEKRKSQVMSFYVLPVNTNWTNGWEANVNSTCYWVRIFHVGRIFHFKLFCLWREVVKVGTLMTVISVPFESCGVVVVVESLSLQ